MDWFLYNDLRHERVNIKNNIIEKKPTMHEKQFTI